YHAACCLTSIAAYRPDLLVAHDAVRRLVRLLDSNRNYVRDQAIWAICNIAGQPTHRDFVLASGALIPLLNLLTQSKDINLSTLRLATLTLCHLCRGMPPPYFEEMGHALERHLNSNDDEVLGNVCVAIMYVCKGSEDEFLGVIESEFVPKLVELLRHPSPAVFVPVLITITTLVRNDHDQIQVMIDCGALPSLCNLLTGGSDIYIKKATFVTISSITAYFQEQTQLAVEANLVPSLVYLAQNTEPYIKNDIVCAISNVTLGVSHDQIKYLVDQGCIKPLCDLLVCPDMRTISACLNGLERILIVGEEEKKKAEDVNSYCKLIEDAEGLEKIESLQQHGSNEIYEKALKILNTYWAVI
ncbi:hypothetical protein CARUB_v10027530mg, partial [Capsella rubella]